MPRAWFAATFAALTLLACGAYHNTLLVPELLDDPSAISDNPTIRNLAAIRTVLNLPATSGVGGRPLANFSFALNFKFTVGTCAVII
jgi:hypothetical protein